MAKEQIQRYGRLRNHLFFTDIFFSSVSSGNRKSGHVLRRRAEKCALICHSKLKGVH